MVKSGEVVSYLRTGHLIMLVRVKAISQLVEVVQGVPGRSRSRIFLTFGTTRVVGRQPYAPAAFTPGEIPGTHFQWLSREPRKKFPVTTPGIDRATVLLVAQCLNHYCTPGPLIMLVIFVIKYYNTIIFYYTNTMEMTYI